MFKSFSSALCKVLRLAAGQPSAKSATPSGEQARAAKTPYLAPSWLSAPPASPSIPWQWGAPTLSAPVSQLCTSEQMAGELFERYRQAAGAPPDAFHRKVWERIFIWAALTHHGVIRPGVRVLGFGVGLEATPAAFAQCGMRVTATDAPAELVASMGWAETNQHASALDQMYRDFVPRDEFDRLVSFEPVDMNGIPPHLTDFDACWSSCALEHLGSIDHGLDFIESSLATLRPGGIAVHTTEFNLSSNEQTFDQGNLALFRRRDIERLTERLVRQGHTVAPLNFYPGETPLDQHIDLPPYGLPHLKLEVAGYVTTSFGMIVTKAGA